MSNKDIIEYFYEVIVSENLLEELHKYISEDCVQRVGEKAYFIGTEGMKQHLLAVKQTYPDYTLKIIHQYTDGDYVISEDRITGYSCRSVTDRHFPLVPPPSPAASRPRSSSSQHTQSYFGSRRSCFEETL